MHVERADFVSVLTQDLGRARRFYTRDARARARFRGRLRPRVSLRASDARRVRPVHIGQPFAVSPAGLALRVEDVDAARAELEAKGVVFDGDTTTTGVCKQAWFKEPDGNALMLHRRFDA